MSKIVITACGINQLYFEATDEDMPGLVGLGLTEEGAEANLKKCREDLNYQAIRMMVEEAERAEQ